MTLAFTICSVNYLAQAKTLEHSLAIQNPDIQYVIGLTDKLDGKNIDNTKLPKVTLLEVHQLGIKNFDWMCKNYDITELNTAVKPFFIEYLFKQNPDVTKLIYFDPDIIVYQPLTDLLDKLNAHPIIVTPHICSPLHDDFHPNEETHLNTGIFNLGFIAFNRSQPSFDFVKWWQQKLAYECKIDLENGLFVDQNWVNFAPYYIDNVLIEKNLGYNMAYWNLHERKIRKEENTWMVESNAHLLTPLIFFHFSGYQLSKPNVLSKYQNRFTFEHRSDVKPLFDDYAKQLSANHNEYFSQFPCVYIRPKKVIRLRSVRKVLSYPIELLLRLLA